MKYDDLKQMYEGGIPFTAEAHAAQTKALRDACTMEVTPAIAQVLAELPKMSTSALLTYLVIPSGMNRLVASLCGEEAEEETVVAVATHMSLAFLDEIDRRIPIELARRLHTLETAFLNANIERTLELERIADMAEILRRSEPDDDVKDCERRIDKLCTLVKGVALLARGTPTHTRSEDTVARLQQIEGEAREAAAGNGSQTRLARQVADLAAILMGKS